MACRYDVAVWSDRVPLLAGGPEDDSSGPGLQHQSKKVSWFLGKDTYTVFFLQLCNTGIFCFAQETWHRHKNDCFSVYGKKTCSARPPLIHWSFLIKPYFTDRLVVEPCTEFFKHNFYFSDIFHFCIPFCPESRKIEFNTFFQFYRYLKGKSKCMANLSWPVLQ